MRETCPILTRAIKRYVDIVDDLYILARENRRNKTNVSDTKHNKSELLKTITELRVELEAPCEDYPHFGMDETCKYKPNFFAGHHN